MKFYKLGEETCKKIIEFNSMRIKTREEFLKNHNLPDDFDLNEFSNKTHRKKLDKELQADIDKILLPLYNKRLLDLLEEYLKLFLRKHLPVSGGVYRVVSYFDKVTIHEGIYYFEALDDFNMKHSELIEITGTEYYSIIESIERSKNYDAYTGENKK